MNNNFMHTLTAYHLKFSYMKRNNPLREELEEQIKNSEVPVVNLSEVLDEFVKLTENHQYASLINGGKVILLNQIEDEFNVSTSTKRIFIIPRAGKTNLPIQMVNLKENKKVYDFGSDWASTYPHNIFFYEIIHSKY